MMSVLWNVRLMIVTHFFLKEFAKKNMGDETKEMSGGGGELGVWSMVVNSDSGATF